MGGKKNKKIKKKIHGVKLLGKKNKGGKGRKKEKKGKKKKGGEVTRPGRKFLVSRGVLFTKSPRPPRGFQKTDFSPGFGGTH